MDKKIFTKKIEELDDEIYRKEVEILKYSNYFGQISDEKLELELQELNDFYSGRYDAEYRQQEEEYEEYYELQAELEELKNNKRLLLRNYYLSENISKYNIKNKIPNESDLLNRENIIGQMEELISIEKEKSFSIGLFGKWGSGKTTLLSSLAKKLEGQKNLVTIRYNASQYEDQEKIWYSILSNISDEYLKPTKKRVSLIRLFLLFKEINNDSLKNIILLLIIVLFAIPLFIGLNFIDYLYEMYDNIKTFYIFVTALLPLTLIITYIKQLIDKAFPKNYRNKLGTKETVVQDIKRFIKLFKKLKKEKIILIIDELDRCNEKTIVEFFKSIEAFQGIPNLTFIISINPEIVFPALGSANTFLITNSDNGDEQKVIGKRFLEKYIDFTIRLNNNEDYKKLIDFYLENKKLTNEINGLINLVKRNKIVTPRSIIRMINSVPLLVLENQGLTDKEILFLIIAEYFYPGTLKMFKDINSKESMVKDNMSIIRSKLSKVEMQSDIIDYFLGNISESFIKDIHILIYNLNNEFSDLV